MPDSLDIAPIFGVLDNWANRFGNRFVLGLSGGGDSMALAVMLAKWQKQSGAQVLAVCVDHQLRPGSFDDSQRAKAWAQQLGLKAQIVKLTGAWPKTRVQETARNRRHAALVHAAEKFNTKMVLLAHTADDQAETIAFRLARQTGLEGLAGIAQIAQSPQANQTWPCLIGRPLLNATRTDLRTFLQANNQDWIEDPANLNEQFARIRVRNRLADLGGSTRLLAIGQHARQLRDAINKMAVGLEHRCIEDGKILASIFLSAEHTLQASLLRKRLIATGAPNRPFDSSKIDRLLNAMAREGFKSATLAGVQVTRKIDFFEFKLAPPRKKTTKSGDLDSFVTLLG